MINEIWKVASVLNCTHMISGHIAYTNELHVCQLIEGKADKITSLMANIIKDPRIVVSKEFEMKLPTMNLGWNLSMCYSFKITEDQFCVIANDDITLKKMFDMMKNTCEARRGGWKLNEFYKSIVDAFLLKYISIDDKVKFEKF